MIKESISPISILISSVLTITLGYLTLFEPLYLESIISWIIPLFSIGVGGLSIVTYIFNKNEKKVQSLLSGVLYIIFGMIVKYEMKVVEVSIVFISGIYAFINFMAQFVSMIILHNNKTKLRIFSTISTIVSLSFSLLIIMYPIRSKPLLLKMAGIYLILYGLTHFNEFVEEAFDKNKIRNNLKRRFKIRLPVIYTAFLPQKILERINEALKVNPVEVLLENNYDKIGELEVFIHLGKECANGFGHIDICYKDKIYCYGSYDDKSKRLFETISDGVLIEVDRYKYIDYVTKSRHLVSFVLSLDENQCNAVDKRINLLKKECVRWQCDAEKNNSNEYTDYTNLLYLETNAKLYKFKSGYFKTYFVLITNCVKLADNIIGAIGLDIIAINGIITPGIYYNYLNNLFNKKNTVEVGRNIYKKN